MQIVEKSSACLLDHDAVSLSVTHSNMNKFSGPEDPNYVEVRIKIKEFVDKRSQTLDNRKKCKLIMSFEYPTGHASTVIFPNLLKARKPFRCGLPGKPDREFVGRENNLSNILERAQQINTASARRLTVITGLEGVGKTRLALEAAYKIAETHEDWAIMWISGNSYAKFKEGYCRIAEFLEVNPRSGDVVKLVNEELLMRPVDWLLVIDEVDDTDEGGPEGKGWRLTKDMLPEGQRGLILMTTCDRKIAHDMKGEIINLHKLSDVEAIQLLEQSFKDRPSKLLDNPEAQRKLVRFLTSLPLAIVLASNYMAATETSVTRYLQLCEKQDRRFIRMLCQGSSGRYQDDEEVREARDAVSATWLVSFHRIEKKYPNCKKCLERMAFYHSKNIPYDMLEQTAEGVDVEDVIDRLVEYSFVTKLSDQGSVDIHQLVQLAMKNWLSRKQELNTGATSAINDLLASLPFPTPQSEKKWRERIRHAEEALGYKDESVYDHSTWRLLYMVGQANFLFGDDKKAKEYHERACKMEGLQIASKDNSALSSRCRGEYEQAENDYRKAIKGGSEIENQILDLSIKKNLACTFLIQGKHEHARAEYQRALWTEMELLGEEHPSTISTMDSLAFVLKSQGKSEDATDLYRKVLERKERRLGKNNMSTITSIYNLAMMYQREGGNIQAEELHQKANIQAQNLHWEALRRKASLLGDSHPSLLSSYENLALVFERQGNYRRAVEVLEKTVELKKKILGERHASTARSEKDLRIARENL